MTSMRYIKQVVKYSVRPGNGSEMLRDLLYNQSINNHIPNQHPQPQETVYK